MNGEFVNDLRERLQNLYDSRSTDSFKYPVYDEGYYNCLKQVLDIIDEMKESPIYK